MTGDRTCKARFKTPYVAGKRQWERRLASTEEEQLTLELDFPELNSASKTRSPSRKPSESRGRSPSSGGILRRQSQSPSVTRKGRSPSREHVSWADKAKGTKRTGEKESKKQQQKQSKENEVMRPFEKRIGNYVEWKR